VLNILLFYRVVTVFVVNNIYSQLFKLFDNAVQPTINETEIHQEKSIDFLIPINQNLIARI